MKLVTWKKTLIIFVITLFGGLSLPSLAQTTKWLTSNMPHFYEFNATENPNSHYWCGHTALKIAMQYKTGQVKTLTQIHNTFYANSANYRTDAYCNSASVHWCAKLQDLVWAARLAQNGGYGRGVIASATPTYSTAAAFFTAVKTAINANNPVIVPSNIYYGNAGHFWVIVGYTDWGTPQGSALYVRDVAITNPIQANADRSFYVQDVFNGSFQGQLLVIK